MMDSRFLPLYLVFVSRFSIFHTETKSCTAKLGPLVQYPDLKKVSTWIVDPDYHGGTNRYNIAKGTTDPRVEFLSQVQTKIVIKLHLQNLDQASTSKSLQNIDRKNLAKLQILPEL